jgi:hypothetical protein
MPVAANSSWDVLAVEEVADRSELPVLVLRTPRADAPLALRWSEAPATVVVLVDRGVVRVEVNEGGGQRCMARFRLRQLAANHLDVELPVAVALAELKATLGGKGVGFDAVDDGGRPSASGKTARLRLGPEVVRLGSVLELSYVLPPGGTAPGSVGLLTTMLQPPALKGDAGAVPVCWQVVVPPSWVVLGPESGPGAERTWVRRGWLAAPQLTRAAVDAGYEGLGGMPEGEVPAVVCWRSGADPLTLTHVTQLAWWLACSPVLLVLGLGLYGLGGPHGSRGLGWCGCGLAADGALRLCVRL